MNAWKRLDERLSAGRGRTLWQFVKFNLVSLTVTVVQLALANLLPLVFDGVKAPVPGVLRPIFNAKTLFYKTLKNFRLNFSHKTDIYFSGGISAYTELRVLLLDTAELRQKFHRTYSLRQNNTVGQNRLQKRIQKVFFKAYSLPRICFGKPKNGAYSACRNLIYGLEFFSGVYAQHTCLFFKRSFSVFGKVRNNIACSNTSPRYFHICKAVSLSISCNFEYPCPKFRFVLRLHSILFQIAYTLGYPIKL